MASVNVYILNILIIRARAQTFKIIFHMRGLIHIASPTLIIAPK